MCEANTENTTIPRGIDYFHNERNLPRLYQSVVAFVDILGFSELVRHNSNEVLREFHEAINFSLDQSRIRPSAGNLSENFLDRVGRRFVKIFSDNIAIVYPISEDAEIEMGFAFSDLAELQMFLSSRGYFLRGAITVGDVFIDETTIFGPGLIDAYLAENTSALNPRIILTEQAREVVQRHFGYYLNEARAPQNRDLFRDADGFYFVNYLDPILIAEDEVGPYLEYVENHKDHVERALAEHRDNPRVFSKYLWSATYHNYFCQEYRSYPDLVIDLAEYTVGPSRIAE